MMRRRTVLQLGLGGISALSALSLIGTQRAMAAGDGPETFVYVSNAGTKDIYVLGMDRDTGELTMVEKVPVPGAEKTSLVSLPMALAPNKRFIHAQLRSEPYPVSTFSVDPTNGKLTHLDLTPLVDQMAYINVDKTGKHLLGASRWLGRSRPSRSALHRRQRGSPRIRVGAACPGSVRATSTRKSPPEERTRSPRWHRRSASCVTSTRSRRRIEQASERRSHTSKQRRKVL